MHRTAQLEKRREIVAMVGADARPNWDEQPTRPSLAGKYDRADLRLHFGIRGDPFLHLRGD
jgi:hypothetical protein